MAGCNCGGNKQRNIAFEVKFKDGSTKVYATTTEAQQAIRQARGGTFKAVRADSVVTT